MNIDLAIWISGAFILFILGLYGLMTKKDALRLIISIEILVIAANLTFIGFAYLNGDPNPLGQTYTLLSLALGGTIIGLALTFLVKIYDKNKSVDIDDLMELKW